jgi:hypothetical protein
MTLKRITFTGADDSVDARDLAAFSAQGNNQRAIEWGILVSASQEGAPRFPTRKRLVEIACALASTPGHLSLHVCGRWVREILLGNWRPLIDHYGDELLGLFDRVQLNFHGDPHGVSESFYAAARELCDAQLWQQIIVQMDGMNDQVLTRLHHRGVPAAPLFDLSGGLGILPAEWNPALPGFYCGYAGGLGPDNIAAELPRIHAAARGAAYWIDMETRVRSADDRTFSLAACQSVLDQVEVFLAATVPPVPEIA